MEKIEIQTQKREDFIEISTKIQRLVNEKGWRDGILFLFVPHTTAGIFINEHADPDVADDIETAAERLVPKSWPYQHREGNSPAHIKSVLFNNSLFVIVEKGGIQLGVWQGLYFAEFDGPRQRQLWLNFLPSQGRIDEE